MVNDQRASPGTCRCVAVNDHGHVIGEDHPRAKLTDHEVWLILELRDGGMFYMAIAQKFEVAKTTVAKICTFQRRGQTVMGQKTLIERRPVREVCL